MSTPPYNLAENVKILKTNDRYNVYITSDSVYFVAIDKCSYSLKKLKRTYTSINAVGIRFGALGALITTIPLEMFVMPKINRERENVLNSLRNISLSKLNDLPGYGARKQDVQFEERKKERYRVHLGDNWLLLDGQSARNLEAQLR
jgi:hypothetical protein